MRIIFLDIDGVLNSLRTGYGIFDVPYESYRVMQWRCLDPVAIGMLNILCQETEAKIVISSTWRKTLSSQELIDGFKEYFDWDIPIIGATPIIHNVNRGTEIETYLVQCGHNVESYVIVDDDSDMLSNQPFVNVNYIHGLSVMDMHRMWKFLDPLNEDAMRFVADHSDNECKKCRKREELNAKHYIKST